MKQKEAIDTARESSDPAIKALADALAAPFAQGEVKFKPGVIAGSRALALAYVDARVIQDRLDEVLGVLGWQDEYECLPDGSVVCRLSLRIGDEWITKMDVGGPSEQPDEGDRRKAAFSDALKRAAVKFGVGRYLYRLPQQWVDYDARARRLLSTPSLPSAAEKPTKLARRTVAEKPAPRGEERPAPARSPGLPADGAELERRLKAYDEQLARQGLCKPGELVEHVLAAGAAAGHPRDMTGWSSPAIQLAVEQTRVFEGLKRGKAGQHKDVA